MFAFVRHGELESDFRFPVKFTEKECTDAGDEIFKAGAVACMEIKAIYNFENHIINFCILGRLIQFKINRKKDLSHDHK